MLLEGVDLVLCVEGEKSTSCEVGVCVPVKPGSFSRIPVRQNPKLPSVELLKDKHARAG